VRCARRPGTLRDATTRARMIELSHQALSPEALREEKIADVQRQLEHGDAVIVFDAATATTNIIRSNEPTT
jgi:Uncharacterised protein family (UPF0270)